mgnify:CR=1 FL=1
MRYLLMLAAAGVAAWLGVAAERRSLEDVAPPLTARRALRTDPTPRT